eukprot:8521983-Pyramimonas_sp.AAC.1
MGAALSCHDGRPPTPLHPWALPAAHLCLLRPCRSESQEKCTEQRSECTGAQIADLGALLLSEL